MPSHPTPQYPRLLLATANRGKLVELKALLAEHGVAAEAANCWNDGVNAPAETGTTFIENALIKARDAMRRTGEPCLAEDSGFSITALAGRPGVTTARFAEQLGGYRHAAASLLQELSHFKGPQRHATMTSALAIVFPGECELFSRHRVHGEVPLAWRGEHGFGFDALFVPKGIQTSFGEMSSTERAGHHPRRQAFVTLAALDGAPRQ